MQVHVSIKFNNKHFVSFYFNKSNNRFDNVPTNMVQPAATSMIVEDAECCPRQQWGGVGRGVMFRCFTAKNMKKKQLGVENSQDEKALGLNEKLLWQPAFNQSLWPCSNQQMIVVTKDDERCLFYCERGLVEEMLSVDWMSLSNVVVVAMMP